MATIHEPETNPTVRAPTRREWRPRYVISELGTAVVLALVMLFAPYDAPSGTKPVLAAVLAGLALLLALADATLREPVRQSSATGLQCLAAICVAAIAPSLWHASLVAIVGLCAIHMTTESRQNLWVFVAMSFGSMAAIALLAPEAPTNWPMALVVGLVFLIGSAIWFRELVRSRRALLESHKQLLERALAFSWEIDRATGEIRSVAGNVRGVLGYEPKELLGQHFSRFAGHFEDRRVWHEGDERHSVVTASHRNGRTVILHEVRLPTNDPGVVRGVSSDVTEANQAIEALQYQAEHDALTGLANRTALRKRAKLALDDPSRSTALLVVDLDRFKDVNDTLGHPTGDQLLSVLARRFEAALSDEATVARIGGDEFAFLLPDCTGDVARVIADRVAAAAAAPIQIEGFKLSTSASIGIALAPDQAETYDELLKCADIACYSAKQVGGGVRSYDAVPHKMSRRRLRVLSEMPKAIENGEFELFLQPKVAINDRVVIGAEGLARWRHPELGLLYPGDFLDAFDVASDYQRFTNEMIRQAIDVVAAASAHGPEIHVAVNLGTMSLRDEGLPARISAMLEVTNVPGHCLVLEVIESDLVPNDPLQQQVFSALTELGIRLSIDDFGTGYSNFSQLKSLAADEIKIDRSFIQGLGESYTDLVIVKSMIDLTRKLGYSVIAEGVEREAQADMLAELGCQLAQGYFYARPMPQADFLDRLAQGTILNSQSPAA